MSSALVQVKLELGHKATPLSRPNTDHHTHSWKVFVRGPEGCNIQHFVDKVVFLLHPTYPKPKRVCKEPPYEVEESGYAGFNVEIIIHFRNKNEPKKITFMYDLFLKTEGVVNHIRCEKLTFQNPTEDFKKRLLKSGGFGISGSGGSSTTEGNTEVVTSKTSITTSPKQAPVPPPPKRPQTAESKAFADLFGDPIIKKDEIKKKKPIKQEKKPTEVTSNVAGKSPRGDQKNNDKQSNKSSKPAEKPRSHSHSKELHGSTKPDHSSGGKHGSSSRDRHSAERHTSEKHEKSSSGSSKSATKRVGDNDEDSRDSFSSKKKKKKEKDRERERDEPKNKEEKEKKTPVPPPVVERQRSTKDFIKHVYSTDSSDDSDVELTDDEKAKDKEREREKEKAKEKEKERKKRKEKEKADKEAELKKEQEREAEKQRQKELEAEKQKEKQREAEREKKEKEQERQKRKERELEKQKAKEKELEKKKQQEKLEQEAEKEKQRQQEREAEKKRQHEEEQRKERELAEKQRTREKELEKEKDRQAERKKRKLEKERAKQKEKEKLLEKKRQKEQEEREKLRIKKEQEKEQAVKEKREKDKRKEIEKAQSKNDKATKKGRKKSSKGVVKVKEESDSEDDVIHVKTEKSPPQKPAKKQSPRATSWKHSDIYDSRSDSDDDPFGDNKDDSDSDNDFGKSIVPAQKPAGGTPKPLETLITEIDENNSSSESMDDDDVLSPIQNTTNLMNKNSPPPPTTPGSLSQTEDHVPNVIPSKPQYKQSKKAPNVKGKAGDKRGQHNHPAKKIDAFTDDSSDSSSSESSGSDSDSDRDEHHSENNQQQDSGHESDPGSGRKTPRKRSSEHEDEDLTNIKVKKEEHLSPVQQVPPPSREGVIKRAGGIKGERLKSPRIGVENTPAMHDSFATNTKENEQQISAESHSLPTQDSIDIPSVEEQNDSAIMYNRPNVLTGQHQNGSVNNALSQHESHPNQDQKGSVKFLNKDNYDIEKDKAPNGEILSVLLDLQRQLEVLTNQRLLQQIVGIIVDSGEGTVTKNTFDFDLCKLDAGTVKKIQNFIDESTA